jgi:hypothetical protein
MSTHGKLYLVPAPLDFGCDTTAPLQQVMPQGTLEVAARLGFWVCENARSTRAYLKRVNELHPLAQTIQTLQILELPREVVAQLLGREGTWARVTTLGRRRVEDLPPGAPVSLAQAERDGRLVQKARRVPARKLRANSRPQARPAAVARFVAGCRHGCAGAERGRLCRR